MYRLDLTVQYRYSHVAPGSPGESGRTNKGHTGHMGTRISRLPRSRLPPKKNRYSYQVQYSSLPLLPTNTHRPPPTGDV